jgi:hypothetical protein
MPPPSVANSYLHHWKPEGDLISRWDVVIKIDDHIHSIKSRPQFLESSIHVCHIHISLQLANSLQVMNRRSIVHPSFIDDMDHTPTGASPSLAATHSTGSSVGPDKINKPLEPLG